MHTRYKTIICVCLSVILAGASITGLIILIAFVVHMRDRFEGHVSPGDTYTLDGVEHTLDIVNHPGRRKWYPLLRSERAAEFKHMYRTLEDVCARHGIDVWVSGGTLLGAIRHQGFIPWDDDMDVHVRVTDVPRLLGPDTKQDLLANGLKCQTCDRLDVIKVVRTDTLNKMFIDVLAEGRVGDHWGTCANDITQHPPRCDQLHPNEMWREEDVFPLQRVPFEDIEVWIPHRPHVMLDTQYGKHVMQSYPSTLSFHFLDQLAIYKDL